MPKKEEKFKVELRQKALVSQQGSLLLPQIHHGFHARRNWTVNVLRKNLARKLNLDESKFAGICAQLQIRVVGKEDTEVPEDQCMGTLYDQNHIRDTLHLILKDESSSVEPVEPVQPPVQPPGQPLVATPVASVEAVELVADEAVNDVVPASELESQVAEQLCQAQLAQSERCSREEWELWELTQELQEKRSESQAQLFREEIHKEKTESAEVKAALSKAEAQIADLENEKLRLEDEKLQLRDRVSKMAKEWKEEKKEKDMAVQEQDRCTGAMHRMENLLREQKEEVAELRAALEKAEAEKEKANADKEEREMAEAWTMLHSSEIAASELHTSHTSQP